MFSKTQSLKSTSVMNQISCTISALALATGLFATSAQAKVAPSPKQCALMATEALSIVKKEFGLEAATVTIDASEVCRQLDANENPGVSTRISLQKAMRESLKSFIEDRRDVESPGALILELAFEQAGIPWTEPVPAEVSAIAQTLLKTHLNHSETKIVLLGLDEQPENGESVSENWIVRMKIGTLSDHIFWAIVDRAGEKKTYNYGFN